LSGRRDHGERAGRGAVLASSNSGVVGAEITRTRVRSMRSLHRRRFLQSNGSGNRDACVSSRGVKSAFSVRGAAVSVVVVAVEKLGALFSVNTLVACALYTRSASPAISAMGRSWRPRVMCEYSGRPGRTGRGGRGEEGGRREGKGEKCGKGRCSREME
jgi:hypothetical protein